MDKRGAVEKTAEFVRQKLAGAESGHGWWHIYRVWKLALHIAKKEGTDLFVVELAALLHDVADWKFAGGDDKASARISREWLEKLGVEEKVIAHVCDIAEHISFKGAGAENKIQTLEGKCVQDADRLDALGAIGVARAFSYGGHAGREMYDPEVKPVQHASFEEYKKSKGTSINHFYEKLLLLKGRMNTKTGREMAEGRHKFMEQFLAEFYKEWEGET